MILSTVTLGPLLLQVGLSLVSYTGKRGGAGIGWRQAQHHREEAKPGPVPLGPGIIHLLTDNQPRTSSKRKDCWTSAPMPFVQRLLLTTAGFALLWSHRYVTHVLSELLKGRGLAHFLCLWLGSLSWLNPPKREDPGSRVPIACPHLLPVHPGAEAGLAHCLWCSLLTAVPCLGGHEHAEVALGVLR